MDKVNILGVKISKVGRNKALQCVEEFLNDGRQHTIFTPNPEMIVLAQKDPVFKEALNQACLALPDGAGLVAASYLLRQPLAERVAGVDFTGDIVKLAAEKELSIYFLGGKPQTAAKAALNLKKIFPNLKIAGANEGGRVDENGTGENDNKVLKTINEARPDILFVAFGHGKQEKWILNNLIDMPSVKLTMGVGGAFDFIAEEIKRAPQLLRTLNLEWLWRLALEPRRLKRIFNAVIVFPILVLKWRFLA